MASEWIEPEVSGSAADVVPARPSIGDAMSGDAMSDDAVSSGSTSGDLVFPDPVFTVVRRGFDQSEVRRTVMMLAGDLRAARERELLLIGQLAEATRRAEAIDPLDPAHLTKLLGDEVARILDAARIAATQIRTRADEAATRLFEETRSEAAADAAVVLERAGIEARDILRIAEERGAESGGGAPALSGAETGEVPPGDSAPAVRRRRSGVDPERTAGLFASLRDVEVTKASRPRPRNRTAPARAPEPAISTSTAPSTPASTPIMTPTPTVAASAASARTAGPPVSGVGDDSAGTGVGALTVKVSRAIKLALTDELNELLAIVVNQRGRSVPLFRSLDPDTGPSVDRLADVIRVVLLGSDDLRAGTPFPVDGVDRVAHVLACDIIVPLRASIDVILAGAADQSDPIAESLRRCFRDCRNGRVEPAVSTALGSLEF